MSREPGNFGNAVCDPRHARQRAFLPPNGFSEARESLTALHGHDHSCARLMTCCARLSVGQRLRVIKTAAARRTRRSASA